MSIKKLAPRSNSFSSSKQFCNLVISVLGAFKIEDRDKKSMGKMCDELKGDF